VSGPFAVGERVTEPALSLDEFRAALLAELEKSPTIVPERVAALQSREARRQRRDTIIAERARLYDASERLLADAMVKTNPTTTPVDYGRRRELEQVRKEWCRRVDETWRVPPEVPTELQHYIRGLWWAFVVIASLTFLWFFKR